MNSESITINNMLEIIRLIILLAVPMILFIRPKFIRNYLGDTMPIVLGVVSIIAIVIQLVIFQA